MNLQKRRPRSSLTQRLGMFIFLMVVATAAAAGGNLWFSAFANHNIEYMHQATIQSGAINELQQAHMEVIGKLWTILASRSGPNQKADLDVSLKAYYDLLQDFKVETVAGLAERDDQTIAAMSDDYIKLEALANDIYNLSITNRGATALRRQVDMIQLQNSMQAHLGRLNSSLLQAVEARSLQVQRSQRLARIASIAAVVLAAILALYMASFVYRLIAQPLQMLTVQLNRISLGDFSASQPLRRSDEIGEFSRTIALMADKLATSWQDQEARIEGRTRDLEKRTLQVQVAAEVARDIAAARETESLLEHAVNLVRDRFGFYHAGIFLTDASGAFEVLRASTGEAGRQMLKAGHSLKIGQVGLVGMAAESGEARVVGDVEQDAAHYKNPLLPETRAEAALPLKAGGRTIGVLDVQSLEPNAFGPDNLDILQILADQLAIAIQNSRLLKEVQENLEAVQNAYGKLEHEAWQQFFKNNPHMGYTNDGMEIRPLFNPPQPPADPNSERLPDPAVRLPLQARGERIGMLEVWPYQQELSVAEITLLTHLSERLGQILETARLYEETQARAAREEMINRLTSSIARSLDLDGVLRTTAMELGQLPTVRAAVVVLGDGGRNGHRP